MTYSEALKMHLNYRKKALKIVVLQAFIVLLSVLIWLITQGLYAAVSALCGGFVCLIANMYFVFKAFTKSGARAAREIMKSFYIGEFIKLAIIASLFALIFSWGGVAALPVLITFIAAQLGFWFAPLVVK